MLLNFRSTSNRKSSRASASLAEASEGGAVTVVALGLDIVVVGRDWDVTDMVIGVMEWVVLVFPFVFRRIYHVWCRVWRQGWLDGMSSGG